MFVSEGGFASDAYDCFVIGSGPAGVSVALALAEARKKVLIFETGDEHFPYDPDPDEGPSQGRWAISGLDLPPNVLTAIYAANARRLIFESGR